MYIQVDALKSDPLSHYPLSHSDPPALLLLTCSIYNVKSPMKGGDSVITLFRKFVRASLIIWSEDQPKCLKTPTEWVQK